MALVPANSLMGVPRTTDEAPRPPCRHPIHRPGQHPCCDGGVLRQCKFPTPPPPNPRTTILTSSIGQDKQKALWAKPSVDVEAFAGKVDPAKVKTRPRYLNAVLIQSRGRTGMICEACFTSPGRGPFTDCRRAKGYFNGACGNCKWRDHAARCSVRQPGQGSGDEDSEDSEEDEAEEGVPGVVRLRTLS